MNQWVKRENTGVSGNYLETNENENNIIKLWAAAKAVLRRKVMMINAYIEQKFSV